MTNNKNTKVIWFENLNSGQLGLGADAISEIHANSGSNCISVITDDGEEHLVKSNDDNRQAWDHWEATL